MAFLVHLSRLDFFLRFGGSVALLFLAAAPSTADAFQTRVGKHIHLTTDVASAADIDDWVAAFDAAVPQWAEFWNLPSDALDSWTVEAFVMHDKNLFRQKGKIPNDLPDFPYGYATGNQIWVVAQQGNYYTRQLLLHEGVHALAFHEFGGAGPTWYREGTAELLSTHAGNRESVIINRIPASRESAPFWGRFKVMDMRRSENSLPPIESVMKMPADLKGDVESYGWSWAAAMLLNEYPEYREPFVSAARRGRDSSDRFTRDLYKQLADQWPVVQGRWRLLTHDLDYGFDWQRERIDLSTKDPLWNGDPIALAVASGRGWQSAGVVLPSGTKLAIDAGGQCVVAENAGPWVSEPPGVTIQYVRSRPLGQLLVCVLPTQAKNARTLEPLSITGFTAPLTLSIAQPSWLLFRVNDDVGRLSDNSGEYNVSIQRE